MSINESIVRRIDEWKNPILATKMDEYDSNVLVYDGIVDEDHFSHQSEKILFLLKDGNEPFPHEELGNQGCTYLDFQKALKCDYPAKDFYRMWRVMCLWTRIIEDPNFCLSDCYDKNTGFSVDNMREYLSHIATVNIKKLAGIGTNSKNKATSYDKKLRKAVSSYYPLIKEEISLIKPTLVICGGTFEFIQNQYSEKPKQLSTGKRYFTHEGCDYLEFVHPSAFYSYEKFYCDFKNSYNELCKEREMTKP